MRLKWLNVLLLAVPATGAAYFLNQSGAYAGQLTNWIFALALVAVIPLASLIGQVIDILQTYMGERLGGLLGASFSNVPELSIGILLLVDAHQHVSDQVLRTTDLDLVRNLLLGSVVNNILFVLGSTVFLAALRNGRMAFQASSAATFTSMLALAVVGLALPTIATSLSKEHSAEGPVLLSIPFGIILMLSYCAFVATSVFNVGAAKRVPSAKKSRKGTHKTAPKHAEITLDGAPVLADALGESTSAERILTAEEHGEDERRRIMSAKRREMRRQHPYAVPLALIGLAVATAATVAIAATLVSTTTDVIKNTPLTPLAVGLILFPIVCNLGEQAGAIGSAWRNDMEAAMSIAVGSSVQVALFVTPLLVLLSFPLALGNTDLILTLIFQPLILVLVGLVAFVYALVSLDGETTWLEGLQLLAFYAMVVAVAFALPGL